LSIRHFPFGKDVLTGVAFLSAVRGIAT